MKPGEDASQQVHQALVDDERVDGAAKLTSGAHQNCQYQAVGADADEYYCIREHV